VTGLPFLIVSDGPNESSGLGRIARDLGALIMESDLLVDLVSIGGPALPYWRHWPHIPMGEVERAGDWGRSFVEAVWRDRWGDTPGICWVIWDPGRLAAYDGITLPVQLWSYPAIDADNVCGAVGGPAGAAIAHADRVIAYGRWASTILKRGRPGPVPYLPHGLTLSAYAPPSEAEQAWVTAQLGPQVRAQDQVIGCVATNQPRKDLGLYFRSLQALRERGHKVYGWLHTDTLTKAWSVVQLVEDCGLAKRVTVSTREYSDRELAILYQRCSVTIAPGLGEGFGYPIVESLASGVPVVHGDFGGGRELVPKTEWRFPVREVRLEGIYAQRRPVFRAEDVANAIERIWQWRDQIGEADAAGYCRGAVAHLDWASLWPRWRAWIRHGVEG
jgi:glycosyltransferase involved in cell wall biosynthesis